MAELDSEKAIRARDTFWVTSHRAVTYKSEECKLIFAGDDNSSVQNSRFEARATRIPGNIVLRDHNLDGHPFGSALIGPELAHSQAYDVSVILNLPRTPSNLASGNFMLDLALLEEHYDSIANISSSTIVRSRRPAILTYSSPLVDTARRVSRMPFYVFNWKREAETLRISMMEHVEFLKGKKHFPGSLRLEIQSREHMQVYTATVRFDARFTGLRWLMYKWRILSFVTFSTMFWLTSVAAASVAWMALSSSSRPHEMEPKIEKPDVEDSDIAIKEESDDEDQFRLSKRIMRGRPKDTAGAVKEEEEIEESTLIGPLAPEQFRDSPELEEVGASTQSRPRSRPNGHEDGRVQRRRSHIPEDVNEKISHLLTCGVDALTFGMEVYNAYTPGSSSVGFRHHRAASPAPTPTPYPTPYRFGVPTLAQALLEKEFLSIGKVVNDDGPPSNQSSPYVHSLVHTLQSAGHTVTVVLPHRQRSWIGKAHLVGVTVKPMYFRPGTLHHDDGTIHHLPREFDGETGGVGDEWMLVDSTPASCVQIGLFHYNQDRGPVDIVISGPNYGRNTTAIFSLSSGTVGGALEAAVCGVKAIALSYAFSSRKHDPVIIAEASRLSIRLIEHLHANWGVGVDLYSINVPLELGVEHGKILYTPILDNRWKSGSCFEEIDAETSGEGPDLQEQQLREGEVTRANGGKPSGPKYRHRHFKWAPKFTDVYRSVEESSPGNDGWAVKMGHTSVTPLKANFMHLREYTGEIKLNKSAPKFYAIVECDDEYVQPLVLKALQAALKGVHYQLMPSVSRLPTPSSPVLQYRVYEKSDFAHVLAHPSTSLVNSYVIRKALIRKHYLSKTVANWITKHPDSILRKHVKPTVEFELDFAEFLDEALLEAYELRDSLEKNEEKEESEKDWWILKPGMSDRGHGIRLFNSEASLRAIFEEWEEEEAEDKDDEYQVDESSGSAADSSIETRNHSIIDNGVVTSQLRHFIAQPYIHPPLLLPSSGNRKFHIRAYVLAIGSLKVYVYNEMLALSAEKPYAAPWEKGAVEELTRHLTNTCLQTDSTGNFNAGSICRFWALDDRDSSLGPNWKESVYEQICAVTGAVFEAAARGMMIHFQTLPNAFELFGVDFLIDQYGDAWLLELNAFPDFRQTGEELKDEVIGRLFEEVVEVAVKPFFGIGDTSDHGLVPTEAMDNERKSRLRLVSDLDLGLKR
ncbi:putative tubulin--tyrosine ligase pby1 [Emydomyces testavorans]|uniref:Tubulin--tyrosine ligase pby1 n=1 Tax=Emydomyces testavorans TaxID=2070801 RepID=A0AAF0DBJ9_9EURO|nr:putative tubulin--tyrosine ligase pby1 [Emydomyces testavorans]